MQATRKAAVRFRERSELLDFLLEVTAATSQTLDLDQLLANVAEIVKKVIDCELFAILLYSEKRHDLRIRYAVGPSRGGGPQSVAGLGRRDHRAGGCAARADPGGRRAQGSALPERR